jgi:hypothetical protein
MVTEEPRANLREEILRWHRGRVQAKKSIEEIHGDGIGAATIIGPRVARSLSLEAPRMASRPVRPESLLPTR